MSAEKKTNGVPEMMDSPPPYNDHIHHSKSPDSPTNPHEHGSGRGKGLSEIVRPCIIPQTTMLVNGKVCHPFIRAYAPALGNFGISAEDLVIYIDGLNARLISKLETKSTGRVSSHTHSPRRSRGDESGGINSEHPGSIEELPSGIEEFLRTANSEYFHSVETQLELQTTQEMLITLGLSDNKSTLPELNHISDLKVSSSESRPSKIAGDIRLQYLDSLSEYILPLQFDVPDFTSRILPVKRTDARRSARILQRDVKDQERQHIRLLKHEARIENKNDKLETKLARLEDKIAANDRDLIVKLAKVKTGDHDKLLQRHELEKEKLIGQAEDKVRKTDSRVEKKTNKLEQIRSRVSGNDLSSEKILWIVIVPWYGDPLKE